MLTIDDLSDDDLLEIFDFYVVDPVFLLPQRLASTQKEKRKTESWKSLVLYTCVDSGEALLSHHYVVLNLQLFHQTGPRGVGKATVDVWPALPLFVCGAINEESDIADLCCFKTSHIENFWTAMQVPFPELAVSSAPVL